MRKRDLVAAIKAARAPIFAAVQNGDDIHYVRVAKAALLDMLELRFVEGDETGYGLDAHLGDFYFDRDYGGGRFG